MDGFRSSVAYNVPQLHMQENLFHFHVSEDDLIEKNRTYTLKKTVPVGVFSCVSILLLLLHVRSSVTLPTRTIVGEILSSMRVDLNVTDPRASLVEVEFYMESLCPGCRWVCNYKRKLLHIRCSVDKYMVEHWPPG